MAKWSLRAGTSPLWLDSENRGIEKLRPIPVAADHYRQPDRVRPGLPVGQVDAAAIPIPFEGDDFTEAAADQHQQSNDGDDMGAPALVAGEHGVEPRDSPRCQIPVHGLYPVAFRVPAEVGVLGAVSPGLGRAHHHGQDRQGGAGNSGLVGQAGETVSDLLKRDGVRGHVAESGLDVLADHADVGLHGRGLSVPGVKFEELRCEDVRRVARRAGAVVGLRQLDVPDDERAGLGDGHGVRVSAGGASPAPAHRALQGEGARAAGVKPQHQPQPQVRDCR